MNVSGSNAVFGPHWLLLYEQNHFWTETFFQNLFFVLSPVHTKNENYKDNYKDNDISVHTSERYRRFILSARSSAALNSRARDSRIDSDWLSVFVSFISWKKNRSDSNDIVSLCLYRYSCGVDCAIL